MCSDLNQISIFKELRYICRRFFIYSNGANGTWQLIGEEVLIHHFCPVAHDINICEQIHKYNEMAYHQARIQCKL